MPLAWLTRLAHRALRCLQIRQAGGLLITFIDRRTMRAVNRRFTGHTGVTDVLSFRYPDEPIVGEIVVAPACARSYARRCGLSYRQELGRYVVHGLLHWVGHEDKTPAQQRAMRALEDRLLNQCTT